jgi:hypothetical protein
MPLGSLSGTAAASAASLLASNLGKFTILREPTASAFATASGTNGFIEIHTIALLVGQSGLTATFTGSSHC